MLMRCKCGAAVRCGAVRLWRPFCKSTQQSSFSGRGLTDGHAQGAWVSSPRGGRYSVYWQYYLSALGQVGEVRLHAQQFGIGVHSLQHGNLEKLLPRSICDAGRSASVKIDLV